MEQTMIKGLLGKAQQLGFSEFEIYVEESGRFSASIHKGELDKFSSSAPAGISVRGIYQGKLGNAYTEKMSAEALDLLLEDCRTNALINETEDKVTFFAPPADISYPVVDQGSSDLSEVPSAEKIEILKSGDATSFAADERVEQVENQYADFRVKVGIYNTHGLEVTRESNLGYIYYAPILRSGEETKNEYSIRLFNHTSQILSDALAREAVERTKAMLGAQAIESGSYKIVLDNKAMASLLMVMASAFSAEAADKGLTFFKDKVGTQVANQNITVVDDPHYAGGFASTPFDSEGVPTKVKRLIDKGQLTGFLHNLKTASKFGVEPTGNGFKASFKSPVGITATNLYMEKGSTSRKELLEQVGEGVLITELEGLHAGINAITGDFSLACKGMKIESGTLTDPINQITVSGNFFGLLMQIVAAADDLEFHETDGSAVFGAPSVYVGNLVISGK